MTHGEDELKSLLRAPAPRERDPLFRLRVLERRERLRTQQRLLFLLAVVVVAIGGCLVVAEIGGVAYQTLRNIFSGLAAVLAGTVYAVALMRLLR